MLEVQRNWEDLRRVHGLGGGHRLRLMSNPTDRTPANSPRSRGLSDAEAAGRVNSPLVIVSEHGRHSEAQRRVVRAQAARASAAQSRVTRARNREGREAPPRELATSSEDIDAKQRYQEVPGSSSRASPQAESLSQPLLSVWLNELLSASGVSTPPSSQLQASSPSSTRPSVAILPTTSVGESQTSQELFRRQLPLALPRGFTALQQRIPIADSLLVLLSRTACFDFGSPGIEQRLQQHLFELVSTPSHVGHPIQAFFRIACVCLTIYQGQRLDGAQTIRDAKYVAGLHAAWSEAASLDERALVEPKSAEAALWAVFMVCVATGSDGARWYHVIMKLMEDLQLGRWEQVRSILLEFIYPVSLLDEPCKQFFSRLKPA